MEMTEKKKKKKCNCKVAQISGMIAIIGQLTAIPELRDGLSDYGVIEKLTYFLQFTTDDIVEIDTLNIYFIDIIHYHCLYALRNLLIVNKFRKKIALDIGLLDFLYKIIQKNSNKNFEQFPILFHQQKLAIEILICFANFFPSWQSQAFSIFLHLITNPTWFYYGWSAFSLWFVSSFFLEFIFSIFLNLFPISNVLIFDWSKFCEVLKPYIFFI